ncbi:MAG: hypothetical protein R3A10_05010 [Caldilineaceae bacterium]
MVHGPDGSGHGRWELCWMREPSMVTGLVQTVGDGPNFSGTSAGLQLAVM